MIVIFQDLIYLWISPKAIMDDSRWKNDDKILQAFHPNLLHFLMPNLVIL